MKKLRIGEILVEDGYVTEAQIEQALAAQKDSGKKLGDLLVDLGFIREQDLMLALQKRLNVPIVQLQNHPVSIDAVKLVPEDVALKYQLLPIQAEGGVLTVATNNPLDFYAFEELALITGMRVEPVLATKQDLTVAIQRYYAQFSVDAAIEDVNSEIDLDALGDLRGDAYSEMLDRVENAPVVRLVNSILTQAYRMRASDIHIEPREGDVRVRFRIDGDLVEAMLLNAVIHVSLVTRLKIMADIDIAERRLPQDGRFAVTIDGNAVNVRLSTLPTVHGEKIVIRLLGDNTASILSLSQLGMEPDNLALLEKIIHCPNGIVLVTGPTGSGKSTTIYAILQELSQPNVNIVTIEDPVEKVLEGINQVHVNPRAGLTFASGLRSVLRQDPDIIMIGEIRDGETASIAARSAITGHLVFSTVHTNDAASTFLRIIDMGVEPYIVASSIVGVVSQRLVKLICPHCREEDHPTDAQLNFWEGERPERFYHGKGCVRCNFTGYMGRTAIHEIIPMSGPLSAMILRHAPAQEINAYVRGQGGRFLKDNLMDLVRQGRTTLAELLKVTYSMEEM